MQSKKTHTIVCFGHLRYPGVSLGSREDTACFSASNHLLKLSIFLHSYRNKWYDQCDIRLRHDFVRDKVHKERHARLRSKLLIILMSFMPASYAHSPRILTPLPNNFTMCRPDLWRFQVVARFPSWTLDGCQDCHWSLGEGQNPGSQPAQNRFWTSLMPIPLTSKLYRCGSLQN